VALEQGMSAHLAQFQGVVDLIDDQLRTLNLKIGEMSALQERSLHVVADSDLNEIEKTLAKLTDDCNSINNGISNNLKNMQQDIAQLPQNAETLMRRNQHAGLMRKFMDSLTEYQAIQKRCRDGSKNRFARQYRIVNPKATDEEIAEKLEEGHGAPLFSTQLLEQNRGFRAKQALAAAEERQRDLERIAKSIVDVQQLFIDLQRMIDQQGDLLNKIEDNVNKTEVHVTQADEKLGQAVGYARGARKKRIYIAICLFLTLIIGAVSIYLYFKTSSATVNQVTPK